MGRFIETLESLFEREIRAEWDKHPMWPHEDMSDAIDSKMQNLAEQFYEVFIHPKKSK